MVRTLYRSLTRHRLFAAINIGGLALGIAVFLVLHLVVSFERRYDRWLPGVERLFLVQQTFHFPGVPETPIDASMGALIEQLRGDFPDVRGTRIWSMKAAVRHGRDAVDEKLALVDLNFFHLFRHRFLAGDPRSALSDPDGVVLSRTTAERYFAPGRALGATLDVVIDGKPFRYRVAGVVQDAPANTSIEITMMAPLVVPRFRGWAYDHWGSGQVFTVLALPGTAAAQALQRRLPAFVDRHARRDMGEGASARLTLTLLPLVDLHLKLPSDRLVISTLATVGVLTLAIAMVNYVNLATAQAGMRAREVAVRKAIGATRRALIVQFLGEAVATAALAMLIGLALTELALPWINAASGGALRVVYIGAGSILPGAMLLTVVIGMAAGSFPALVLSRFQPAAVLASARAPGGGRTGTRLRQALVVGQFAITIALTVSTAVLVAQTRHLGRSELGFRRDGLILLPPFADPALDRSQRDRLRGVLGALPGVIGMTVSDDAPAEQFAIGISVIGRPGAINRPGAVGTLPTAHIVSVGPRFFDVYGARLLAGRLFDDRHATDALPDTDYAKLTAGEHGVVVTKLAAARLGFATPDAAIGRTFRIGFDVSARIVGVVDDIRFGSPREPTPGSVYLYYPNGPVTQIATLRYAGTDPRQPLAAIERVWRTVVPGVPFEARTAQAQLHDQFYKADAQRSRLFIVGAVLAVAIGCIGLYGLAAFDTARRVKEIGIRKSLGASTRDVLLLLLGRFLVPVAIANLLAWPLAFVAMRRWLSTFDDRIALSPWFFVVAAAAALGIAVVTVIGQSWRVARARPAHALRYE